MTGPDAGAGTGVRPGDVATERVRSRKAALAKAGVLVEALPWLRRFHGARELLYGGVLLLILLFAPKGIYGLIGLTLRLWHSREDGTPGAHP